MVEPPLMMRLVVGSILQGGPIEVFLVPASVKCLNGVLCGGSRKIRG